jgi:hypothetical protein
VGIIGILAQGLITNLWIAPIVVNIKSCGESEREGDEAELLIGWNKLRIHRMGLNALGLASLIAALVV